MEPAEVAVHLWGHQMGFKQLVVEKDLLRFYYVTHDPVTVDLATRCEHDELKVLLKLAEHFLQTRSQTNVHL